MDTVLFTRFNSVLNKFYPTFLINRWAENKLNTRFNHSIYGLLPQHRYVLGFLQRNFASLLSAGQIWNSGIHQRSCFATLKIGFNYRRRMLGSPSFLLLLWVILLTRLRGKKAHFKIRGQLRVSPPLMCSGNHSLLVWTLRPSDGQRGAESILRNLHHFSDLKNRESGRIPAIRWESWGEERPLKCNTRFLP